MIGVIGLGYVGLTSAICFHSFGEKVIGIDVDINKLKKLKEGEIYVHDIELEKYFKKNYQEFDFSNDINRLHIVDDVLICVPTEGKGSLDLSIVKKVIKQLDELRINNIWIRSTIDEPQVFDEFKTNHSKILSFPEFLREGKCWVDFFEPPLLILGGENVHKSYLFEVLEKNIRKPDICSTYEAITIKIASNAFHALKVTFTNELKNISWSKRIDINKVMSIFQKDTILNVSKAYLNPGLPFGGPCLPKDTKALSLAIENSDNIFNSIINSNENFKLKYSKYISELPNQNIGFYGLEFKKGTGDLRNSPIIDIINSVDKKKNLVCFDEYINEFSHLNLNIAQSLEELYEKCEIVITYNDTQNKKSISWTEILNNL